MVSFLNLLPYREYSFEDDWKLQGACRTLGDTAAERVPNFFYEDMFVGRTGDLKMAHIDKLRRICASCPVLEQCREFSYHEEEGFLAGKTADERQRERRRRNKERLRREREAAF